MSLLSISGSTDSIQVNNADLTITNPSKKIITPRINVLGINGVSVTTVSNVGIANTNPEHTLSVGTKFR